MKSSFPIPPINLDAIRDVQMGLPPQSQDLDYLSVYAATLFKQHNQTRASLEEMRAIAPRYIQEK